jgi:hypothetical protein
MSAEQIWNDVRAQRERPVFKRVDERHPYDLYLGVDVHESPVLMLLSDRSVEQLPRLRSLEVSQNLRHDGKFAILISLATPDLLHPFCSVCEDLIESLRNLTHTGGEAQFLLNRLEKWRRLLEVTRKGLSQPQLLGLMGELLFLEQLVARIGPTPAITAWLGPTGAPQDFEAGGHIYEIKVCPIGAHTVIISSLEQLHTANTPTTLIVFSVGPSSSEEPPAITPNALVSQIRNSLTNYSLALSDFELKLADLGFDESQPECDVPLIAERTRAFEVRESFPRLTPVSVPGGIIAATYSLNLDQCLDFEIPFSQVLET